jgi:hypothetical protein
MSQTKFDKLKETIRSLIQQDLEEATVTGAIDGGEGPPKTPFAFRGKRKKDKKKKESIANQSGYHITEAKFAVKFQLGKTAGETATIIVDVGSKGAAAQIVAKNLKRGRKAIVSVKRVEAGKAKQIDKKLENVNEADDSALKAKMAKQMDMVKKHRESMKKHSGKDKDKADRALARMKAAQAKVDDTQDKIIGLRKKESVNEGRYHDYRNDDTMTPKQKIGRSMMEVRDTLRNLENIVGMNIRLKNEIGVDSTSYWKRTHTAMKKISERLVKLANKVGQLH